MHYIPLLLTILAFVVQNTYFVKKSAPIKEKLTYAAKILPFSFGPVMFIALTFIQPFFDAHIYDVPIIKELRAQPRLNARIFVCLIVIILTSISIYFFIKFSEQSSALALGQYILFAMLDCIGVMFDTTPARRAFIEIVLYLFAFCILHKDVIYAINHASYYKQTKGIVAVAVPLPLHIGLVFFKLPESAYLSGAAETQYLMNIGFCILLFISSVMICKLLLQSLKRAIYIQQDMEVQDYLTNELLKSQEGVILTFSEIVSNKSGETGGHVKRVAEYSSILARELGYPEEAVDEIRLASMMHDIGKLMVSNEIIEKPGALTSDEFEEMKKHVVYGEKLLAHTGGGVMKKALVIAKEHHERWDGKGYVLGLKGNQTSELAQIVSVADVFDALTSKRSYKEPWPCSLARDEIIRNRGTQFSPRCVDAFEKCYEQFLEIRKAFPDENGVVAANDGLVVSENINKNK
ncbi:HD-GYP domain-containing protein [Lachnospiraceae bacterium C1.1]|nr:HD domain-containing protein [Lachnospiraceae bacterium C1.1]